MGIAEYFYAFLGEAAGSRAWWLPLAITIATIILEDTTTTIVGVLAADGVLPVGLAWSALTLGILFGDLMLYGIGKAARTYPWLRRYEERQHIVAISSWIEERTTYAVIFTRFLPGLRIPLYIGCGFLGIPFKRFALPVLLGATIWTTFLFTISFVFGHYTLELLGHWRWPIIIVALVVLTFVGRAHFKRVIREYENSPRNVV